MAGSLTPQQVAQYRATGQVGPVAALSDTEVAVLRRRLEAFEARLRAILDSAVDAIITIDENGIIESTNPSTEKIFGYAASEIVGQNIKLLMPEPYREEHDGYLKRYVASGEKKIIGIGREVTGQRKDGSSFPMQLSVSETFVSGRRLFTGTVHDMSERKKSEAEFQRLQRMADRIGNRGRFVAAVYHAVGALFILASAVAVPVGRLHEFGE